jgi:hypothetical protein
VYVRQGDFNPLLTGYVYSSNPCHKASLVKMCRTRLIYVAGQ